VSDKERFVLIYEALVLIRERLNEWGPRSRLAVICDALAADGLTTEREPTDADAH